MKSKAMGEMCLTFFPIASQVANPTLILVWTESKESKGSRKVLAFYYYRVALDSLDLTGA